jgi:hypothetical protein
LCSGSEGEKKVYSVLKDLVQVCPKYQVDTCIYDFYFVIEGENFLVDYHGPKHYYPEIQFFSPAPKFYAHDGIKKSVASSKGYHYLEISYDDWTIDITIHRFLRSILRR